MTTAHPQAATRTQLAVEYLFSLTASLLPLRLIENGPQGTRGIIGLTGGSFEGPRLRGTLAAPGGEWATMRADGSGKNDVRLLLETDDGALILMTYQGIGRPAADGTFAIRTAPLFETGDARYAWLNGVQAVGLGTATMSATGFDAVTYDVYALQ